MYLKQKQQPKRRRQQNKIWHTKQISSTLLSATESRNCFLLLHVTKNNLTEREREQDQIKENTQAGV